MFNIRMQNYNSQADYGEVYRLFTDESAHHLIANHPERNDMQSFQRWLESALTKHINDFVVFRQNENFIGFSYSYDCSFIDGHTHMTVAVKNEFRNLGYGAYIGMVYLKRLFSLFPLRKVYMNVYEINQESIDSLKKAGLTQEAVLKKYRFINGRYCDLRIFSITREEYNNHERREIT